jgi:DNA-binding MarR family transcriptional regulator
VSPTRQQISQGALDGVLGYHVVRAQLTTRQIFFQAVGEPLDLRPVEYSLLMLLHANPPLTPKQLAQALALSSPNLTILLDKMQQRGAIDRVRSPTDKRSQHILLSEAGQALTARALELTPHMDEALKPALSAAERAMLMELLKKVAGHRLDQATGKAAAPRLD